jgi:hypothetical protein
MQRQTLSPMPGLPGGTPIPPQPDEAEIIAEIRLTRPVLLASGERIETIRFRDYTMRDVLDCGEVQVPRMDQASANAARSNGPVEIAVRHDPDAIAKWFTRLSGLPSSLFTKISGRDGHTIIGTIISITGQASLGNLPASPPISG